jgi:cardiolipin synthase
VVSGSVTDPGQLLVTHLLSIVGFLMATVLIATVFAQRRAAGTTFAWLLAIVLIPYVGVPLYLVFGGRKLGQRRDAKGQLYPHPPGAAPRGTIAGMLCASGAPPSRTGNALTLYPTGEQAFAEIIAALETATRAIRVSTLILAGDEVGEAVLDVLVRKAKAGVEVRVLLDALFKRRASHRRLAALAAAGGRFAWFMPVWHLPFRTRLRANLRLHRKIILVDGALAIVGGMNLASEYMGPSPKAERWRDLSARIVGPAIADLDDVFRADWTFAAHEELAQLATTAPVPSSSAPDPGATPTATGAIQVVGSGPDVANDLLYDALLSAVFEARDRLWIATPYFVPDEAIARGLVLAARRGVDVRVVVPAKSNHRTADYAGAGYLRELAHAGGTISCYAPTMMHAKCVLIDDKLAVIGSANFDMRSLFLNYEISMFCTSREEVGAIAEWFKTLWPACGTLVPAGRWRGVVESIARLVAPLE